MKTERDDVAAGADAGGGRAKGPWKIAARNSFRRQIILTFVIGFFLLIAPFAAYMIITEKAYLYRDSSEDTASLAASLAASSRPWVLANDVGKLQDVVRSFQDHPQLRYAMVISPTGRVLAHTDETKIGQFVADEQSLALLKSPPEQQVVIEGESIMDVAMPIKIDGQGVGWARVGQTRDRENANLRRMMLNSALFVLAASALSLFAAILVANRFGVRIGALVKVAEEVQAGNFGSRARIRGGEDEITKLASSFNQMLDALARNQRELREASLYTRSLIEASLDPLVTISPEGKITDVNDATSKATGVQRAQLIGTDFSAYFTDPEKARAGYRQVFAQGFVTDYPLTIRHRDGRILDVLYNASIYRDEAGKVLGVFAAARDITERKRAEEQLRRSEHSLSEAQRIAHLGNWELDLVNNVLTWSDEIYRIFEIDPEKFGASYEAFLNAIHPDDRDVVNHAYNESVKSRTPYDIAHRLQMKDGRIKYVNEKCETYYDKAGKPLRSVGTVHDITERKQAEDEIVKLNRSLEQRVIERTAQLEAANKELEAFSYSVSHDLRTPLRAIDGFSNILLEDYAGKLDDEGKRLLNVVRDNSKKMAQLIDDILQFSRVGRTEMAHTKIDMEQLAREVCAELQPIAAGHEVKVEIGPLPKAQGDRALLHQVFVNLLSNAIKFSRKKEPAIIKVGATGEGNETVYFVRDNGAGFDMQYAGRLFGVFQRLHTTEEFEGTGIGLAIIKRIVARHGGRTWAEGKINEGATFYFALPLAENRT